MSNLYSDHPPVNCKVAENAPPSKYVAIEKVSGKRSMVNTKNYTLASALPITMDDVYGPSVYFFYVPGHDFPLHISLRNLSRLFFAVTYLGQKGYLVPKASTMKPMTEQELQKAMCLGELDFAEFCDELLSYGVFRRGRTITGDYAIFVDETLFCCGGYPYYGVCVRLNINGIRALYKKYGDQPELMAHVFRAMIYTSVYWNRICEHPTYEPYIYIEHKTAAEFVWKLGTASVDELAAMEFTLKSRKYKVFTFEDRDDGKTEIMINPMIFCTNRSYYDNFDSDHGRNKVLVVIQQSPKRDVPPLPRDSLSFEKMPPDLRAKIEASRKERENICYECNDLL